jgi:hypothetical protein
MGEEFNYSSFLNNLQNKYSGAQPMNIGLGQLSYQMPSSSGSGYQLLPAPEEYVAKGFEPSSKDVVGNESAQNFAQHGIARRNDLVEAYKTINDMISGTGGIPLPGSSDIRLHYGAGGQQYSTSSIAGLKKPEVGARLSSSIEDRIIDRQKEDFRHSWEKSRVNPYTGTAVIMDQKKPVASAAPSSSNSKTGPLVSGLPADKKDPKKIA